MKPFTNKKLMWPTVVALNLSVIFILIATLSLYAKGRENERITENIDSLTAESNSIAEQLESYFIHQYNGVLDRKLFLQNTDNAFDKDGAMQYLLQSNSNDSLLYQLVECKYVYTDEYGKYTYDSTSGYSVSGVKFYSTYSDKNGTPLIHNGTYTLESLGSFVVSESQKETDDSLINLTEQITIPMTYYVNNGADVRNRVQGVAIYSPVTLPATGEKYMLMCMVGFGDIITGGIPSVDYEKADSLLINANGTYISRTTTYISGSNDGYWSYLKEIYGSDSKEPGRIQQEITSNESGVVNVRTGRGKAQCDAVLVYSTITDIANCKFLSIVPESSLKVSNQDWSYTIIILSFVLFLVAIDGTIILSFAKRLKTSLAATEEAVKSANAANLSKSHFLSRMSHEIRTPLNAVIGYNTIARTDIASAKTDAERKQAEMKVMDCLEKSSIASKHLLTIINDVLDMSAIESGKIKIAHDKFDFKGLINSLTTVFYTQARSKGVDLDVVFGSLTAEWFIGDQMRTNQILTNLLSNAIKFTPEGGTVTMNITQLEVNDNKSHVHFKISDTGIGISPEAISRIWSPFEQGDSSISRRFGGTGLGLSITKNLIDMMGGSITVNSAVGKGTVFNLDLYFELTENTFGDAPYDFNSVNALVVDDDLSTCDYVHLLFNRCGAKCTAVTSGQDAINAVQLSIKANEPYTVCLVDWRMPGMDGIETIRRIREIAGSSLPIAVLSAYDFSEIADKASKLGIHRFISKPLFQSSLFDLLVNMHGLSSPEPVEKNKTYDFNGTRILLAEDNLMNMEIAKKLLMSVGFIVDGAWNGKEAVTAFCTSEPGKYSAILMDVHMPEMNGLEATRSIRRSSHVEASSIPIIAMTADAFAENVAEAIEAGMNDHVAKPIDLPKLFGTLEKYIGT